MKTILYVCAFVLLNLNLVSCTPEATPEKNIQQDTGEESPSPEEEYNE